MRIVIRADASILIGTGHIMRCLTLADALTIRGAQCEFICREHPGNLINFIRSKGYIVHSLSKFENEDADLPHSKWLGATQMQDAQACVPIVAQRHTACLIVDNYALDKRWESAIAKHCSQVMVIDDLADRFHTCQILLDQTFGRNACDYHLLVPRNCTLLCGSNYALLRPEFAELRPHSLQRRRQPKLQNLLISLGGVDKNNITSQLLNALRECPLPADCVITVVMGATAPWLNNVRQQAESMPWRTIVSVGVNNMAQVMEASDLAIGAAGTTTWERCCLGLPTMMMILADNQRHAAMLLEKTDAVHLMQRDKQLSVQLTEFFLKMKDVDKILTKLALKSAEIVDGMGTQRVANHVIRGDDLWK